MMKSLTFTALFTAAAFAQQVQICTPVNETCVYNQTICCNSTLPNITSVVCSNTTSLLNNTLPAGLQEPVGLANYTCTECFAENTTCLYDTDCCDLMVCKKNLTTLPIDEKTISVGECKLPPVTTTVTFIPTITVTFIPTTTATVPTLTVITTTTTTEATTTTTTTTTAAPTPTCQPLNEECNANPIPGAFNPLTCCEGLTCNATISQCVNTTRGQQGDRCNEQGLASCADSYDCVNRVCEKFCGLSQATCGANNDLPCCQGFSCFLGKCLDNSTCPTLGQTCSVDASEVPCCDGLECRNVAGSQPTCFNLTQANGGETCQFASCVTGLECNSTTNTCINTTSPAIGEACGLDWEAPCVAGSVCNNNVCQAVTTTISSTTTVITTTSIQPVPTTTVTPTPTGIQICFNETDCQEGYCYQPFENKLCVCEGGEIKEGCNSGNINTASILSIIVGLCVLVLF